jgi:hypothetical protein
MSARTSCYHHPHISFSLMVKIRERHLNASFSFSFVTRPLEESIGHWEASHRCLITLEREAEALGSHCQVCIGMIHSLSWIDGSTWKEEVLRRSLDNVEAVHANDDKVDNYVYLLWFFMLCDWMLMLLCCIVEGLMLLCYILRSSYCCVVLDIVYLTTVVKIIFEYLLFYI